MATWYVRTTGNDSNGGTDPVTDAKLTLAGAIAVASAGDTIDLGAGTFSVSATTTIDDTKGGSTPDAPTIIRGAGPTTILTSATNSVAIITTDTGTATYFLLRDLKITHTAGTRGVGLLGAGANATQPTWSLLDVEFDGCLNAVSDGSRLTLGYLDGVTVRNSTGVGLNYSTVNAANTRHLGCKILDNAGGGVLVVANLNAAALDFERCVFSGNTGDGVKYDASTRANTTASFRNCTFEGNSGDGLDLAVGSTGSIRVSLSNSVFYGNSANDLVVGTLGALMVANTNNAYGGSKSGYFTGENEITLSADPFTSAAGEDWTPNATAGGGADLRYAGTGGADIGAVQHQASGGVTTNIIKRPRRVM